MDPGTIILGYFILLAVCMAMAMLVIARATSSPEPALAICGAGPSSGPGSPRRVNFKFSAGGWLHRDDNKNGSKGCEPERSGLLARFSPSTSPPVATSSKPLDLNGSGLLEHHSRRHVEDYEEASERARGREQRVQSAAYQDLVETFDKIGDRGRAVLFKRRLTGKHPRRLVESAFREVFPETSN